MNFFFRSAITLLIVSLFCWISQAADKGRIGAGYGILLQESNPEVDLVRNVTGSALLGGAFLLVKGGLTDWMYVELTLQYGHTEFIRRSNNNTIRESTRRFHIPVLFRFPWKIFSVGAGFYGSYRIGSTNTQPQFQNSELTSANDYGQHGLEFAIGLHPPMDLLGTRFFLDFRSHYSLTPRANENEVWNKLLVGLTRDF